MQERGEALEMIDGWNDFFTPQVRQEAPACFTTVEPTRSLKIDPL
jgi:hypothetical protein